MKINNIDTDKKVLIIAEIGNNHEGSYTLAEELVGLAIDAGVDAIKFQTFKTKYFVDNSDSKRYNLLKSFQLKYSEFEKLSKYATDSGALFISTPLDLKSAEFLVNIVDAIKISSGDNNFFSLIKNVAKSSKPIILSTGLSDMKMLRRVVKFIEQTCSKANLKLNLGLLHCVSAYPVEPKYANLNAINDIKNNFRYTVGYSDHTLGLNASLAAVGVGARIIEKHFTKNKNFSSFRDHTLSADPIEMKILVERIREIESMLGSGIKHIMPPENDNIQLMRRSAVAKNDLKKGKSLKNNDILWVRPAGEIEPGDENLIIGKKLIRNITAGKRLQLSDFID